MTALLRFLSRHPSWVFIVFSLSFVSAWYIILRVLRRARRAQDDRAPGDGKDGEVPGEAKDGPRAVATLAQTAEIELSFRRAMKALRAFTPGSRHRYQVPWYLLLGSTGSGKTTIVETVALPRRFEGPDHDSDRGKGACRWHFFDGGVVLDIAGSLFHRPDGSSDEGAWNRVLSLLKRYRPERPVDGVVLTLNAADLLAWETRPADELRAYGTSLFRKLRDAQGQLGVRFPVYVVVTQCDTLPGFSNFVGALPPRFHNDAFGWSNPYALDTAFRNEWVDEAYQVIGERLRHTSLEVLAARDAVADAEAIFRFPDVVRHLAPPSRVILSEIFDESAYHQGFFLRGVYFSGMVEPASTPAATADDATPEAGAVTGADETSPEPEPPGPVFLSGLFQKKIFAERGLARRFARGVLDRNRAIRWIQIAAMLLMVVGIPGMWWGQAGLRREGQPLVALLDSVAGKLRATAVEAQGGAEGDDLQGAEIVVSDLLKQMASLETGNFWSVFLPSSWFGGLDRAVKENLTGGFQEVILPTLRLGTVRWADTMSQRTWGTDQGGRVIVGGFGPRAISPDDFQEYEAMVAYVSELAQYALSVQHFNQLAQPGFSDMRVFTDLFEWYYEEELPPDFLENDAFYRSALAGASVDTITFVETLGFTISAGDVAGFLVERFYGRLIESVAVLGQSLRGTLEGSLSVTELRNLQMRLDDLEGLLSSLDSFWFDPGVDALPPALRVVLDSIPDSTGLISKSRFVEGFETAVREVRSRQLAELRGQLPRSAGLGQNPIQVTRGEAGTVVSLSSELQGLRAVLDDLLGRTFMLPTLDPAPQVRPALGARATWDMAPLDEALDYLTELHSFESESVLDFPAVLRGVVTALARDSVEAHVRQAVQRAMVFELAVEPMGRGGREQDLRARLAGFDEAALRLVHMLELDMELGGSAIGETLAQVMILEGSDLLAEVDSLLAQDGPYRPANGNLEVWRGQGPVALVGFGVTDLDGLEDYLARQRGMLQILSRYAAPVLGYLALQPIDDELKFGLSELGSETEDLLAKWNGIVTTLDQYANKVPGNSLDGLEQFIRQDMAIGTLRECGGLSPTGASRPTRDYFEGVRSRLARELLVRCRELALLAVRERYGEMAEFFSSRLAGRFPFVDLSTTPNAPDADTEAVRALLEMYDRVEAPLGPEAAEIIATLPEGDGPADFMRRLGEVRAFLGPVLLPEDPEVRSALDFRVELRTNRSAERGADQIVDWILTVAEDSAAYRGSSTGEALRWRLGEEVSVTLQWATESGRRPASSAPRMSATVDDRNITWRYRGPWALLRLFADHRIRPEDLRGPPSEDRGTLSFRVVTLSRDATADVDSSRDAIARVFLKLKFSDPQQGGDLPFPRFPFRALPLSASGSSP